MFSGVLGYSLTFNLGYKHRKNYKHFRFKSNVAGKERCLLLTDGDDSEVKDLFVGGAGKWSGGRSLTFDDVA